MQRREIELHIGRLGWLFIAYNIGITKVLSDQHGARFRIAHCIL
jgi:hypothetical protein